MADLEFDVDWFKGEIDKWEEFQAMMYFFWWRLSMTRELPKINERFPDELKEVVPLLNEVREKLIDILSKGEAEVRAMKEAMMTTAKQYIETNAANQEQIEQLKGEIDA